ncbi:preprotein translocase subunit YajC [Flexivirga oryzae]|uniref:Preprotein translocase subunit YajC n=1 Tax=Flexivirga oryzae TaxID=1794944 RepID=A0A839N6R8_9MICO|nr:preprotein translocase subunit YajC [Flexivirga oryzae]MBB2891783.1 preprotein translocase subunit YajC [Flexivirga oryzae]
MGTLILVVPLLLIAWLFWTQRRRQQQMRSAQDQIEVGQEVSTTSGLLGTLVALDDEEGSIEVSPGVQVRFVRRAIMPREHVTGQGGARQQPDEDDAPNAVDLDKHDDQTPETKAE